MNLADVMRDFPHLASPMALAAADMGRKFMLPRHLDLLNRELMHAFLTPDSRLMVNIPYRHGKSQSSSLYFPAWVLLLFPETQIIFISHSEEFSEKYGGLVKQVIERFGPDLGVDLQQDTKAKAEWVVKNHGGGMVCRGWKGSVIGRGGNLILYDDLVKNVDEATSTRTMERIWDFHLNVALSRLEPGGSIVNVGTRWSTNDVFGRILRMALQTKEPWRVIKFKALAEENDLLGRKPGEALWPERYPARILERIKLANPRGFKSGWQQEPEEEQGTWFQPYGKAGEVVWPRWREVAAGAYSCDGADGGVRRIFNRLDCISFITMDWAWSKKKTSDWTAMGAWLLLPDARLMLMEVVNARFRPEELAPELEKFCFLHRPSLVGVETGHPTLATGYRAYRGIPEIRWLSPAGRSKLARSLGAITMSQNGRILVPHEMTPWLKLYLDQLRDFTGDENTDEHDDMVDATGQAAQLAQAMRGRAGVHDYPPEVFLPGREAF